MLSRIPAAPGFGHCFVRYLAAALLASSAFLLLSGAPAARASCNAIPGTANSFRGSLGIADRPFAVPGEFVELRLLPDCDAASPGFSDRGSSDVVTLVFTPPNGPRNAVVLAPDCDAIATELAACADALGRAPVCRDALANPASPDIQVIERDLSRRLRFRFPDTDALIDAADDDHTLSGPVTIAVTASQAPLPCDLGSVPCSGRAGLVACIDTLFELDGTCGTTPHSVFPTFTALPPPNSYQTLCIDRVPPCMPGTEELRLTADHAGNLLIPMDWRGVLPGRQPSDAAESRAFSVPRLLRATLRLGDTPGSRIPGNAFVQSFSFEGGALPPIFEPQVDPAHADDVVLFGSADAPRSVLRIARRSPVFKQCAGGTRAASPCVTEAECPGGSCGSASCAGGTRDGTVCRSDADCPDGECGASLFDFRDRYAGGAGAIILPRFGPGLCQDSGVTCTADSDCGSSRCVTYRFEAKEPVPLDGLIESPDLFVSVVPEGLDGRDLNGDGDSVDDVLLLSDRRTGTREPIGVQDADGLAATRLLQPPFSYAAVAVEGRITAFLEAEPRQAYTDENGDGDRFDTILRVFDSFDNAAQELTVGRKLAVEAEPAINRQSLAVSDGLVFVRIREAAGSRRRVRRVSKSSDGEAANARSQRPSLSGDGRQVAFESAATNLLSPLRPLGAGDGQGDGSAAAVGEPTAYVSDLGSGVTTRVRVASDYSALDAATHHPWLSGSGRYVAVSVPDLRGVRQVFLVDRDADANGRFDEPGGVTSLLVSADTQTGELSLGDAVFPTVSADGRYVVFVSEGLEGDPRFPTARVFLFDRDLSANPTAHPLTLASLGDDNNRPGGTIMQPAGVSSDGRYVAWSSYWDEVVHPDRNPFCVNVGSASTSCPDVFVRDRAAAVTELASRDSFGQQGNNQSLTPALSADGRYVAFESSSSNLVTGDTNEAVDVFVHDRQTRTTTRVSVSSDGEQANDSSFDRTLSISADGRYVAFASRASNLVPEDTNTACEDAFGGPPVDNCADVFVRDRLTGFTQRMSIAPDGTQSDGRSGYASISADGQVVAFESEATTLDPADPGRVCRSDPDEPATRCQDIFVSEPDPSDIDGHDLNGDGDLDDVLLAVFDTRAGANGSSALTVLGPARDVAVAAGRAVFLMPDETVSTAGAKRDAVVHLFTGRAGGGAVRNLGVAARAVALSEGWVVALVSEADDREGDLNGDGDTDDAVLQVHPVDGGDWYNVAQAADAVAVVGSVVAFITPEESQGVDLNEDGDMSDRVLQLFYPNAKAGAEALFNTGLAAEEFVLSEQMVAFRTSEAAQGGAVLNGDGDASDTVMHVCDVAARRCFNTGHAAIPCPYEACDARIPYRVSGTVVRFVELEGDQGKDLNGDGRLDLILQTFNLLHARSEATNSGVASTGAAGGGFSQTRAAEIGIGAGTLTTVGAAPAGICTNSGAACSRSVDCGASDAACYLPPGGCVENLRVQCDPALSNAPCGAGEFCAPLGGRWLCHKRVGDCVTDADCPAPARCRDEGRAVERLVSPLFAGRPGDIVFVAAGECVENLGIACERGDPTSCAAGDFCTAASGSNGSGFCYRPHGSCETNRDCPEGATCRLEPVVAAARDGDADGIADPFDNCPGVFNPGQEAHADSGVGDACRAGAPTVESTVTPTATPPRVPTPSSVRHDQDGCNVGPPDAGGDGGLLVLLGSAILLRWRRLRRGMLLLVCLGLFLPNGTRAASCVGDCDGSATVTIDEIVAMVDAALAGNTGLECARDGGHRDQALAVDEIMVAVGHALGGCPPVPESVATAGVVLARGLANLSGLPLLMVAAVSATGEDGTCELGGGYQNSCEETSTEFVHIPITVDHCREPTVEGPVRYDGRVAFTGFGFCPDVLLPGKITLQSDATITLESDTGMDLLQTHCGLTIGLDSVVFSPGPCRIKSAVSRLQGPISYRPASGGAVELTFADVDAGIELRGTCDLSQIAMKLGGPTRIVDAFGTPELTLDSSFDALEVLLNRGEQTVALSGRATATALGGTVELTTPQTLGLPAGEPCFTAGQLDIVSSTTTLRLMFATNGSVMVDEDADGTIEASFTSCLDLPRQ